jgi:hypothetical protein
MWGNTAVTSQYLRSELPDSKGAAMNLHPLMAEQMAATRMAERSRQAAEASKHGEPEVTVFRGTGPGWRHRLGMLLIAAGSRCLRTDRELTLTDSCT